MKGYYIVFAAREPMLLSLLLCHECGKRMWVISKLLLGGHELLLMKHVLHLNLTLQQLHILLSFQLLVQKSLLLAHKRAGHGRLRCLR